MEQWFIISCISALISSFWSISVKYGLQSFTSYSFAFWYSIIATIIITVYSFVKTGGIAFSKLGAFSGIGAGVAAVSLAKSFVMSPNPGFSMAIFRMQAIMTTIASVVLFNAKLTLTKWLCIALSVIGVITIVTSKSSIEHSKKTVVRADKKSDKKSDKNENKNENEKPKKNNFEWVLYAIIAGVAMTTKDLFTKKALVAGGKKVFHSLFWTTGLFQSAVLMIILLLTSKSISLDNIKGNKSTFPINKYTLIAGIAFTLYQFAVITASKAAPNVGLVKAVDSAGMVITSFVSIYLFNSSLNTQDIIGMIMIIGGVFGLAF